MKKSRDSSKNRIIFMLVVIAAVSIFLIGKLGYLQIVKGKELKKGALQQWTKGVTIKSKRGIIYDRKGQKLAVSINASTVWVKPFTERKGEPEIIAEELKITAKELGRVLNMDEESIYEKISNNTRSEKIQQWISREEAIELRALDLPGIEIVDDNKRYYPYGNFASHILGFTDIDNVGLDGIESTYNKYLVGTPGRWIKRTDGPGRQLPFDSEKIYEPSNGLSLVLTIDETIQQFAEKAAQEALELNGAKNVSIIIMNPNNGDILGMALKPDYDPNEPRLPLDEEAKKEWEDLPQEELTKKWNAMWRNFSINDIYEPGSTFKLITAAIAIEENIATPNSHFYCDGFVRDIKGGPLKCSKWYDPHKDQTLTEGLNNSCNVVFIDLARRTGRDMFYNYIKAFGFGENTGIDLNGEQIGIIPYSVDSIKEINLGTMSYGHGIAVTPLQLLNAVSTISNGGNLMKPRLVKELLDEDGNVQVSYEPEIKRQVISKSTSQSMLKMMEEVVSKGTGTSAYIPGYRVGGKTGTAEKVIDGKYAPGKYIGSFVAVAPVDDPQVAILVVVDEPSGVYYGGTVAAPVAKVVLEQTLQYLEVLPIFTEKEKEKNVENVIVPDVKNLVIGEAGEVLKTIGLKYTTEYLEITSESKVLDQFPIPGTEVEKGSIVDLYLNERNMETGIVPDLMNKNKEEVIEILDNLKLNYEFNGSGKVKSQNPLPGEEIIIGEKIHVDFGDT